jgi:hypothetical protein
MSPPVEDGPALSVVLACTGGIGSIATTVRHLAAQSISERIELVVVGVSADAAGPPPAGVEAFWGYRGIEIEAVDSIARANAAGVRAARAPVVALAEDHCFPQAGWAAALVEAHEGPWTAVGPAVVNANPGSAVSWADFVIGYGPWAEPIAGGEAPFLPGHNSSYSRAELLSYGERLESMLEAETVLHMDLAARGHRLLLCPKARTAHVNFSRLAPWLRVQVHNGRVFASARADAWSRPRRLLYCAASPLIPLVRLGRSVGTVKRLAGADRGVLRCLPLLALGLALDGWGQMLGYGVGSGRSVGALARYEFRRVDFVRPADRTLFAPPPP